MSWEISWTNHPIRICTSFLDSLSKKGENATPRAWPIGLEVIGAQKITTWLLSPGQTYQSINHPYLYGKETEKVCSPQELAQRQQ